jgi:hypothetical protein
VGGARLQAEDGQVDREAIRAAIGKAGFTIESLEEVS